jgi:hypothetical protein
MVEVAVAAVAEPVAGHVDRRAEPTVVEALGELRTFEPNCPPT